MSALLVEDIDGSESSIEDAASLIQLGFAEKRENPLFNDTDWTKWDGGIIGGVPVSFYHSFSIVIINIVWIGMAQL